MRFLLGLLTRRRQRRALQHIVHANAQRILSEARWENPQPGVWIRTDNEAREFFEGRGL